MIKNLLSRALLLFEKEAALGFHWALGCSQGVGGRLSHRGFWPTERESLVVTLGERNKEGYPCKRQAQRDFSPGS